MSQTKANQAKSEVLTASALPVVNKGHIVSLLATAFPDVSGDRNFSAKECTDALTDIVVMSVANPFVAKVLATVLRRHKSLYKAVQSLRDEIRTFRNDKERIEKQSVALRGASEESLSVGEYAFTPAK